MSGTKGLIIAKFGGTSVSSKEALLTLCQVTENLSQKELVIVVSALSGVTNLLLSLPTLPDVNVKKELVKVKDMHESLARQVISDKETQKNVSLYIGNQTSEIERFVLGRKIFNKAFLDKLASFGEIMSSYLVTAVLLERGIRAEQVISTRVIITNDNFGLAEILLEPTKRSVKEVLLPMIKSGTVPIVTGYIGSTKFGETTTLGRGGSDYTASIIGYCLTAAEIQIWTDVDGMFTSDPRLIKNAKRLSVVSFREASELATFGARVLHPRTIKPAIKANIPVRVLNTFNPKNRGTLIAAKIELKERLRAISFKRKIILINIWSENMLLQKGFLARIFKIFAQNNISVDLVSVSEVSVSVTLDNDEHLEEVNRKFADFASVSVNRDLSMVSLIGEGVMDSPAMTRRVFDILDKEKVAVKMISLGATNINVSLVVGSGQMEKVVKTLHDRLLLRQNNL